MEAYDIYTSAPGPYMDPIKNASFLGGAVLGALGAAAVYSGKVLDEESAKRDAVTEVGGGALTGFTTATGVDLFNTEVSSFTPLWTQPYRDATTYGSIVGAIAFSGAVNSRKAKNWTEERVNSFLDGEKSGLREFLK